MNDHSAPPSTSALGHDYVLTTRSMSWTPHTRSSTSRLVCEDGEWTGASVIFRAIGIVPIVAVFPLVAEAGFVLAGSPADWSHAALIGVYVGIISFPCALAYLIVARGAFRCWRFLDRGLTVASWRDSRNARATFATDRCFLAEASGENPDTGEPVVVSMLASPDVPPAAWLLLDAPFAQHPAARSLPDWVMYCAGHFLIFARRPEPSGDRSASIENLVGALPRREVGVRFAFRWSKRGSGML